MCGVVGHVSHQDAAEVQLHYQADHSTAVTADGWWMRRVVFGAVAAVVALAGGCGTTPTSTTLSTTTPSTSVTTPVASVKYSPATLSSCAEIGQRVRNLPPPPQKDETATSTNWFSLTCPYLNMKGELVVFRVEAWDNGAQRAKEEFTDRAASSAESESGLGVGSAAHWNRPQAGGGCALEVLDENAVLRTFYNSGKGEDPRGESCRTRVRDLTKQFFSAVQPK